MIRYIKYLFLFVVAATALTVMLANRESVTVKLLTPELAEATGYSWSATMPIYLLVLGSVVVGLVLGFVWEWLREAKYRSEVSKRQRQVKTLKREVIKLKDGHDDAQDDVLALLEKPKKAG